MANKMIGEAVVELLLLEEKFLPLAMNWAAEENWSDLLLFILETDSLRYPSVLIQDASVLSRILYSYLTPHTRDVNTDASTTRLRVSDLISEEMLSSLQKLISYSIPLPAVLSIICDLTWQRIMLFGNDISSRRDAGAAEQIIRVERMELPPPEERRRPAVLLDVMEIQYVAQIAGSDVIVDSSKERTSGSTAGAIYYVLGQQNGPPGKLPPGWDLSLRGMVVGEKRRVTLPYTLAYDRAGSKDKKIKPFATVVYTVRLVSLT